MEARAERHSEFRRAEEVERIVLRNVERLLTILPYRTQWEVERDQARQAVKDFEANNQRLLETISDLGDKLKIMQRERTDVEEQLMRDRKQLEFVSSKLVPFLGQYGRE